MSIMDTENKSHPMLQVSETDKSLSTSVEPVQTPGSSGDESATSQGGEKSPTKKEKRYGRAQEKRDRKAKANGGSFLPPTNVEEASTRAESAKNDYGVGKWPRVLVITSQESQALPIKEYAIRKAITGITTNPKDLYQAKAGHYVVKVETDAASKTLLKTTVMADHPVKITPHRTANSSRGVITSKFLDGASDADLLNDLKNQGVIKAMRIMRNRREETRTIILTFDTPNPKEQVLIMNQVLDVKVYVALPIRCYKCQKFGHTKARCTKKESICGKCSQTHNENECTATTPKCANCNGEHHSFDRKCPIYIEKRNILEISAKKHISIKDAEKELKKKNSASYAKVVKTNVVLKEKQVTGTNNKTNFVPDRLQTLESTILKQHELHQKEIADIKAHIRDLENDHVAELRERENIIMNQEQQIHEQEVQIQQQNMQIRQQEKQIAELSLIVRNQQGVNKKDSESNDMISSKSPSQQIATPVASTPSFTLKCKTTDIKTMPARTSSVKRSMSLSPQTSTNLPRSKRDKKEVGEFEKNRSPPSLTSNKTSPRPRSPSAKRTSPQKGSRSRGRSRTLSRWKGDRPRERTSHNPSKATSSSPPSRAPSPSLKATPSSPSQDQTLSNLNKDGAK